MQIALQETETKQLETIEQQVKSMSLTAKVDEDNDHSHADKKNSAAKHGSDHDHAHANKKDSAAKDSAEKKKHSLQK